MRRLTFIALLFLWVSSAASQELVGHFSFDNVRTELRELKMVRGETFLPKELYGFVTNNVTDVESDLNGKFFKQVKGVKGGAVLLDGITAYIEVDNEDVPRVKGDFSVEGWVALGAYPNNLCPIIDNQRNPEEGYFNGYFFGLDALGRLILRIATNGQNERVVSTKTVKLNEWTHIAGTYSEKNGLRIYINGDLAGTYMPDYAFTPAQRRVNMIMGVSRQEQRPYGTIRPYGTKPVVMYYDGLLDEIKIYDVERSASQIKDSFRSLDATVTAELPERVMPTGPLKAEWFGAVNTELEYYEAYDALWHTDKGTDVVVRFDEAPCEFVFWKGANYQAHLVTEKGYWFNNGFNEGWNENGSCEPMSDKQARHSHVKILENNPARVVVQWRYALVDNWYQFAFYDPATRRGDWTNETFYIYPDMVAVREDILLSNAPRAEHEWQESMVVPGPGQRPEDLLEYEALILGNIEGKFVTYSWEHETPPHLPPDPANPCMQLINMKSKYKPFSILRHQDKPSIDVYSGEIRRDVSVFPWWNHWPVAQKPTDGRWAMYADRPSHSSLSHWFWEAYAVTERSMTKLMLTGFTDGSAESLLPLAKSWSQPPDIKADGDTEISYNQAQRCFDIKTSGTMESIRFELLSTDDSPVLNPAFVLHGWGNRDMTLEIDGKKISPGKDFRVGHRHTLNSTDLVAWVRYQTNKPVIIEIGAP